MSQHRTETLAPGGLLRDQTNSLMNVLGGRWSRSPCSLEAHGLVVGQESHMTHFSEYRPHMTMTLWPWRSGENRRKDSPEQRSDYSCRLMLGPIKDGNQEKAGPGQVKHGDCSRGFGSSVLGEYNGDPGGTKMAELCSDGSLPCELGWEVAHPSYPTIPQPPISELCKGIWMASEPCHLLLRASTQRWSRGASQSPTFVSSPVGTGFCVSFGTSVLESDNVCAPLPVLILKTSQPAQNGYYRDYSSGPDLTMLGLGGWKEGSTRLRKTSLSLQQGDCFCCLSLHNKPLQNSVAWKQPLFYLHIYI